MRIPAWALGTVAVILGVGAGMYLAYARGEYATNRGPLEAPKEIPLVPEASDVKPDAVVGAIVRMTPEGYLPRTVTIRRGEAIAFVNASDVTMRPEPYAASGQVMSDAFDADGFVYAGRTWYALPDRAGTFGFRDAVYPQTQGTAIVR